MVTNILRSVSIVLSAVAFCLANAPQADARTINHNCGMKPLQGAVDRANPGDVIAVSGICNERVTVRVNNLTLDGFNAGEKAVIDGTGLPAGALLTVRANEVHIRGLWIKNSAGSGISVEQSSSAVIEKSSIQDNAGHGISVSGGSYARIGPLDTHGVAGSAFGEGNDIQDNVVHGVDVRGSASADVFHNFIDGNVRGVEVAVGGSANLGGNTITFSDRGISLTTNGAVALGMHAGLSEPNTVQDNGTGLWCDMGGSASGNLQAFSGNSAVTNIDASCAIDPAVYTP